MLKLALIGKNISHSQSQKMYEKILCKKVDYTLLDYENENQILSAFELCERFDGVSITAPYKKHFLDQVSLDDEVIKLQSMNCFYKKNGVIYGTNTDFLALKEILKSFLKYRIVVLGSGSMANVCKTILETYQKSFVMYSRQTHGDISKLDLLNFEECVVVNCCAREFVFQGMLDKKSLFYDLNYNHSKHVEYFQKQNINYRDGLELLEDQAFHALKFWNIL